LEAKIKLYTFWFDLCGRIMKLVLLVDDVVVDGAVVVVVVVDVDVLVGWAYIGLVDIGWTVCVVLVEIGWTVIGSTVIGCTAIG
jgi:hypothetical protein